MEALQVIDSTYLIPLPNGRTVMVGAPPEALKVLTLWEYPSPAVVVLPPDPLFFEGLNQASFEFLLFNHLFLRNGLRDRDPFTIVCDPGQWHRIDRLVRHTLYGPSDAEMEAWRTPAAHRRQLLKEMQVVSGEVAAVPLAEIVQVLPFKNGCVRLADGTALELAKTDELTVIAGGDQVTVPRRPQGRTPMPFYFADVEHP